MDVETGRACHVVYPGNDGAAGELACLGAPERNVSKDSFFIGVKNIGADIGSCGTSSLQVCCCCWHPDQTASHLVRRQNDLIRDARVGLGRIIKIREVIEYSRIIEDEVGRFARKCPKSCFKTYGETICAFEGCIGIEL